MLPGKLTYLKGDATQPVGLGLKIIAHVTNNRGGWGRGFVEAISKRWPQPRQRYRLHEDERKLGVVQFVRVERRLFVANMCAQDGYASIERPVAIDYKALEKCLSDLGSFASLYDASVHMPRIGCGLGGGDWNKVEPLIERYICTYGVDATVYDL